TYGSGNPEAHAGEQAPAPRLAQNHGRVTLSLRQADVTLRDVTLDVGSVGEHERQSTARHEVDRLPVVGRQKTVLCAAVDEEADASRAARRPGDDGLDVRESHVANCSDTLPPPRVQSPIPALDVTVSWAAPTTARRQSPRAASRRTPRRSQAMTTRSGRRIGCDGAACS